MFTIMLGVGEGEGSCRKFLYGGVQSDLPDTSLPTYRDIVKYFHLLKQTEGNETSDVRRTISQELRNMFTLVLKSTYLHYNF